jgi:hypothetical protein
VVFFKAVGVGVELPAHEQAILRQAAGSCTIPWSLLQVNISGLPMDASFQYALYTHGFILVSAFPTIGRRADSPASTASKFVQPDNLLPTESLLTSTSQQLRTMEGGSMLSKATLGTAASGEPRDAASHLSMTEGLSEEERLKFAGETLAQAFIGRGLAGFPRILPRAPEEKSRSNAVHEVSALMQETCPAGTSALNMTDADVLRDDHMATAYVNDALPQCLLWGLYKQGLLQYCVKDGDIPGVCCFTFHVVGMYTLKSCDTMFQHSRLVLVVSSIICNANVASMC